MGSSTTSSITVAVPKAEVMDVIADFPAYPQWASALRSAEVLETSSGGRASKVRFTLDAGVIRDTYVLAYTWDGDSRVSWRLAEPGSVVTEMTGGYRLSDQGPGAEVDYELTVDVRIPLPGLLKRKAEKMIIDTALKGLKSRAESRAGGASREPGSDTGGASGGTGAR
jgi:carbon monoxide dehydrogenase subunit G